MKTIKSFIYWWRGLSCDHLDSSRGYTLVYVEYILGLCREYYVCRNCNKAMRRINLEKSLPIDGGEEIRNPFIYS